MQKFYLRFLQEIQLIAPERPTPSAAKDSDLAAKTPLQYVHHASQQTCKRDRDFEQKTI